MSIFQKPEGVAFNLAALGNSTNPENIISMTSDAEVAADSVLNSAPALKNSFDI